MILHILDTEINSGEYNMQTDISLAENISSDEIVLRFYRWKPYCISLGANQDFDDINIANTKKDGLDVVKRPTGGRAVLHSEELTYAIFFPEGFLTPRQVYNEVNFALRGGLVMYDPKLSDIELESQNNLSRIYKENKTFTCFSTSAKSELKYRGKKLVGSAQRKFKNAILQHGSILCGDFHKKIVSYLNINENEKRVIRKQIEDRTIDLHEILGRSINYDKLIASLTIEFNSYFKSRSALLNMGLNKKAQIVLS